MITGASTRPPGVPRLTTSVLWVLAGQGVYLASQFGILIVLARLSTPEIVGEFALGMAIAAPVYLFVGLDLPSVLATDALRSYSFREYLSLQALTFPVAWAVLLGFIGLGGIRGSAAFVVLAVALAKAIEAVGFVFHGLFLQRERMDLLARSMFLKGPLGLAAMATIVWATGSVPLGVLGLAGAWIVVLVGYDAGRGTVLLIDVGELEGPGTTRASLRTGADLSRLRRLAVLSLPVGSSSGIATLTDSLPRLGVERYLGSAQLGVFAAVAYLVRGLDLVSASVGRAISPRLAQHFVKRRFDEVNRLLRFVVVATLGVGFAGIAGAAVLGDAVLRLVYGDEYAQPELLVLLVVASVFLVLSRILGAALVAIRYLKTRFAVMAATAVIVGALSLVLIPTYGLTGAAWALIVGFVFRSVASLAALAVSLRTDH